VIERYKNEESEPALIHSNAISSLPKLKSPFNTPMALGINRTATGTQTRFKGKRYDRFSQSEAEHLAEALLTEHERLKILPKGRRNKQHSRDDIVSALVNGKKPPLKGEFHIGLMFPDGTTKSTDTQGTFRRFVERQATGRPHRKLQRVGKYLHSKLSENQGILPKGGLPVILREDDPIGHLAVGQYIEDVLLPTFQIDESMTLANGKEQSVMDVVTWPFLEDVMADHPLPESVQDAAQKLDELPVYQISSPLNPEAETVLRGKYQRLHKMLAALETAKVRYEEGLELQEAVIAMLIGGSIGFAGETAVEHYLHDGGMGPWAARTGILGTIDVIDNYLGSQGQLKSSLKANGLSMADIYDEKRSIWSKIFMPWKLDGKGGKFGKQAAGNALKGAGVGLAFSALSAGVLSSPDASSLARTGAAGLGATGTATAIPFNVRGTLPNIYLATLKLIKDGKIPVPDNVTTKEDMQAFALLVAKQELGSRLAYSATNKAFTLTPFAAASIIGLEFFGVPREVTQKMFMTIAPAMENCIRSVLTLKKKVLTVPARMAIAEDLIMVSPDDSFNAEENKKLGYTFADGWSRASLNLLAWRKKMPEPKDFPLPNVPQEEGDRRRTVTVNPTSSVKSTEDTGDREPK